MLFFADTFCWDYISFFLGGGGGLTYFLLNCYLFVLYSHYVMSCWCYHRMSKVTYVWSYWLHYCRSAYRLIFFKHARLLTDFLNGNRSQISYTYIHITLIEISGYFLSWAKVKLWQKTVVFQIKCHTIQIYKLELKQ